MGLFTPKWMTDPARTALLDDEEKLKKAYEESGSAEVRQAAVARIKDADYLYKQLLEWQTIGNDEIIRAIVRRLGELDRKTLINAVKVFGRAHTRGYSPLVQEMIREELTDAEMLDSLKLLRYEDEIVIWVVRGFENPDTIRELVSRMIDAQLKFSDKARWKIWDIAVERLSGNKELSLSVLKELGMKQGYLGDPAGLLENITDEELLNDPDTVRFVRDQKAFETLLLDNSADPELRKKVLKYVRNREMAKAVLLDRMADPKVRKESIKYTDGTDALLEVLKEPELDAFIRKDAVAGIDDPEALKKMINIRDYPAPVKCQILSDKTFPQDYYISLVWKNKNSSVRAAALNKIPYGEDLRKIRDEIDDEDLKVRACSRLGHSDEIVGHGNEFPSSGRGYRSSTHYKCRICGFEHTEVCEHDD